MTREKFSWSGFFQGFKTIFTRNSLLIILLYIISKYSNYMKNGFRALAIVKGAGIPEAVFGTLISVFLIVGLLCRAPSGSLCDNLRKKLKYVVGLAFVLRAVIWSGFIILRDAPFAYVLFSLDGILYSFMETALPAILAISVDRRAMGSAYAVMMGITKIATASAKASGLALYNEHSIAAAVLVAGGISIVGGVLCLLFDSGRLASSRGSLGEAAKTKKFRLRDGLCYSMIPLCLIANMSIVLFTGVDNYFPLFADGIGLNYLSAMTLGDTIYGVLNIAVGFLCDVVNPTIIVIVGLAGQVVAPFIWGAAESASVLNAGILIFYCTRFYGTAIRVVGMKAISHSAQGAYQATFMAAFDLFSIVSATIIGFCVTSFGYAPVWTGLGVWQVIALAGYIVLEFTFLRKLRQKNALPQAGER